MDRLKEIHELRRNLDELRARSITLKENFLMFAEMIDAQKFVVSDTLQTLGDEFFGWMNVEGLCLKRYYELFGKDAPETFSEFEDALNVEEKKIRESSVQFQASKFLHLVTADPDLQKILDEHRKILAPIFERKRQSAKTKAALELYAKFVKAVVEPDVGKKYSASMEFRGAFDDNFIARGLFNGELILQMPEDDAIPPPVKAAPPAKKSSGKSSAKAAKAEDKPQAKVDDAPPAEDVLEDSDFVKAINETGALLTEKDFAPWEKSFAVDRNERTKDFSASRFKRDFRNSELLKPILSYTALHGLIATPALCPGNMPPEFMENAAQLLLNKGYLQKFSVAGVGSFYSLTKNFFDFIKTDSGKKFIVPKPSQRNKIDALNYIDFDLKKTLTRTIFFHLHDLEGALGNLFYDLEFYGQAFRVEFAGHGERDLFVVCLWDTTDECDRFLRRLKAYLKNGGEFTRLFVVGLVLEQAGKIFNALEKTLQLFFPKAAAQYIYAFNDETFYRRDTHEKISREAIWNLPAPDDDPKSENFPDTYDSAVPDENQPEPADKTPASRALADACKMIRDGKFYCATAYLKAESLQEPEVYPIYRRLAYALDDPLIDATRSSNELARLFEGELTTYDEIIATSAVLRALFSSDFALDRDLAQLCDRVNKFPVVVAYGLSAVLDDLRAFKAATYTGIDYYAATQTSEPNAAQTLDEVISDAKEFMPMFSYTPQASHKIVVATWQSIFSRGGELSELFQLITTANAQKSAENVERVKRFLADNFLRKNAAIDVENIDSKKFDDFIDDRWREAHKQEFPSDTVKKFEHDSKYRNNMEGKIKRAIEIMCAWVNCARTSAGNSDKNRDEFREILPRLLKNVQEAHNEINPLNERGILGAGTTVLDRTLSELYRRLKGMYNPAEHKFFYVEFLCGDHVITDENCLPNFALNINDGTDEDLSFQVEWHADQKKLPTPKARLKSIFGKGGSGNYGAAKVLDAYLQATEGKSFIAEKFPNFDDIVAATAKDAAADQDDFKGGLTSAQIDGQLQDMPDGFKDQILQIVNNCYDYAVATKNFGVLAQVKRYWKDFIASNAERIAKRLSEDLSRATDDFKRNAKNYSSEEFQESLDYIKQLIGERTFNKVQRCIRDFGGGKLFKKSDDFAEDFTLSRFIADYGDYYGLVQDCSLPLDKLPALKKLTVVHDKFSKKRAQLIENWLPNGIPRDRELGKERIRERVKNLLELLAFDVDSIELSGGDEADSITYTVKLKKTFQIRHSHPIAVFGSDAESDKLGFQVLCLFGKYDEKNLLDRFKRFDTNNTLVLLDTALDLVKVRRPLDKAIKRDKSLRYVFAVIDRVVMMYLIKNCSEQIETKRINDTLMALIMPFSRCQPYVWEPTKSLPPEMFIGRENIMREVKNFDGINIVYGGRQLGKSALLKMARREIDGNNNQRAIFVDLLKEDYTEAALHVSRELIDKKFFDETFTETSDWEELTRAIRNRLSNDAPTKIPYFLLMLDEADKFIETCAEIEYKPIKALARIQQDDYNGSRFKFVIAGLHNIVRFNREQLQKDNGIFPLLKSRTITPFTHEEARQLLEVPLRYLGVNLRDDKFIDTIEETALYFPGLIQCYCEKLLLTLFDSKNYDANTPPYEISKQHLKKVLADEDFLNAIRDRINITLQLGEDRFYYVIAQLLAYLYHTNRQLDGYSPKDILTCAKKIAEELHVPYAPIKDKFLPDDPDKVDALMLELCELNILRKTDAEHYHFSTTVICDYMGTLEHINDELLNLMAEADNG